MKHLILIAALALATPLHAQSQLPTPPESQEGDYNDPEEVSTIIAGCTSAAVAAVAAGPAVAVGWFLCIALVDQAVRRGVPLPAPN